MKNKVREKFNKLAPKRDCWKKRNRYYHDTVEKLFSSGIMPGKSVLEIGCATGDLLNKVRPSRGVGIDISDKMIEIAKDKYPHLTFIHGDIEDIKIDEKFDYIIISDLLGHLTDIWLVFSKLKGISKPQTRIIINYFEY